MVDWVKLEKYLHECFDGLVSKDNQPMVNHSLHVGRLLKNRTDDDVTIFSGYCHDVWEDTDCELPEVLSIALSVGLQPLDATMATHVVAKVSYQEWEYELPKHERKESAIARWVNDRDIRVAMIKVADVDCNDRTADAVGEEFAKNYRSWAIPLRSRLIEQIDSGYYNGGLA